MYTKKLRRMKCFLGFGDTKEVQLRREDTEVFGEETGLLRDFDSK